MSSLGQYKAMNAAPPAGLESVGSITGRDAAAGAGRIEPGYRFLLGLLVGAGLFLLIDLSINLVVDPFARAPINDLPFHREEISRPINRRLYQIQQYAKAPKLNVIVGDSRGELLKPLYFHQLGADDWGNASFGGASLFEEYETLQFIQSLRPVKKAFVTIQLREWNDGYNPDEVREAVDLIKSPSHYYLSLTVLDASIANLANMLLGTTPQTLPSDIQGAATSQARRNKFWPYPIKAERALLQNWRTPTAATRNFLDMIDFAKAHHIELTVLLLPVHDSMRDVVLQTRRKEYEAFKAFIKARAKVMDFDIPSALTADKSRWRDPAHFNPDVARQIVKGIMGGAPDIPVMTSCPNSCNKGPEAARARLPGSPDAF